MTRISRGAVAGSLRLARKPQVGAIDPNRLGGSGEPPLPKIGLALNLPAAAGITDPGYNRSLITRATVSAAE